MTKKTRFRLMCDCGHGGFLRLTEQAQCHPDAWEKYTLEGFDGASHWVAGATSLQRAIKAVRPVCPKCETVLTPANLR